MTSRTEPLPTRDHLQWYFLSQPTTIKTVLHIGTWFEAPIRQNGHLSNAILGQTYQAPKIISINLAIVFTDYGWNKMSCIVLSQAS